MVWKVDHMLSGFLLIQIETESWVSAESTLFHITTALLDRGEDFISWHWLWDNNKQVTQFKTKDAITSLFTHEIVWDGRHGLEKLRLTRENYQRLEVEGLTNIGVWNPKTKVNAGASGGLAWVFCYYPFGTFFLLWYCSQAWPCIPFPPDSSLLIVCEEQCPCRKQCTVTREGAKGRSSVIRQADLGAVKAIFLAQCVCSRGSLDGDSWWMSAFVALGSFPGGRLSWKMVLAVTVGKRDTSQRLSPASLLAWMYAED